MEMLGERYGMELKYAIVKDALWPQMEDSLQNQTISESDFLNGLFRILIIEGQLGIEDDNNSQRGQASIIKRFIDSGGIVIFLLIDINEPRENSNYNSFLRNAGLPYIRNPRSEMEFPDFYMLSGTGYQNGVIFGYDNQHGIIDGNLFWIDINQDYLHSISPVIRDAYLNISRLVLDHPLQLEGFGFLITGNPKTTRLIASNDLWWDAAPPVFGLFSDRGKGVSALITGAICSDSLQEFKTDANVFLINLINLFLRYQEMRNPLLGLMQATRVAKIHATAELALAIEHGKAESFYDQKTKEIWNIVHAEVAKLPKKVRDYAIEICKSKFEDYWDKLETNTQTFVLTGEIVYQQNSIFREGFMDFSVVTIPFSKSIEAELSAKLLAEFKMYVGKSERLSVLTQDENRSKKNSILFGYLRGKRSLTLGEINFLFECINSSDIVISELRNYLSLSKEPGFWMNKDAFPRKLKHITDDLRNGSAHVEVVGKDKAEEIRDLVLGINQKSVLTEIIQKIPQA